TRCKKRCGYAARVPGRCPISRPMCRPTWRAGSAAASSRASRSCCCSKSPGSRWGAPCRPFRRGWPMPRSRATWTWRSVRRCWPCAASSTTSRSGRCNGCMACTAPTATNTKCSCRALAASMPRCGSATTCPPTSIEQLPRTIPRRTPMSTRRHFISQSAAAASALAFPLVAGAQPKTVKIGVLHPVTGALAYSGQQCREGALMAIDDINKAGGIKSMGGAKIEALLGDAQSTPQAGTAEVEKMNEAGVAAVLGAYASAICLATTQAAAKYNLPHVVDVGVADQIVERGLKNTFRFGPGYKKCAEIAMTNLHVLNTAAGKPAKTVMIIHEESLFGTGTAQLLARELPGYG